MNDPCNSERFATLKRVGMHASSKLMSARWVIAIGVMGTVCYVTIKLVNAHCEGKAGYEAFTAWMPFFSAVGSAIVTYMFTQGSGAEPIKPLPGTPEPPKADALPLPITPDPKP